MGMKEIIRKIGQSVATINRRDEKREETESWWNEIDHKTINDIEEFAKKTNGPTVVSTFVENTKQYYMIYQGNMFLVPDMEELYITTQKLHGDHWETVAENVNPYLLIVETEELKEGDVVRFLPRDDDTPLVMIPELGLADMGGVFFVGRQVEDIADDIMEQFGNAIRNEQVDEDDDEEEEDWGYSLDDLEFIPATPIIDYLQSYGKAIRQASIAVDDALEE